MWWQLIWCEIGGQIQGMWAARSQAPQTSQAVQNAAYNTNSNGLVYCQGGRKNQNMCSLHGEMTPLHMACVRGHMGVVIGLVEDKAGVVSIDQPH